VYLVKVLSRICAGVVLLVLLLFLGLIFGPVGVVLEPLARRYGSEAVPSLRIESVG
jgi:hypothetical protein